MAVYHCGSWFKTFLYVYVSPFSRQGPWMWGLCLSSSFWDTHSCLCGDSGILCIIFSLVMFLVTSPEPFCSSPGRELHLPIALCWLFCVGCLFFVFGSLMNNRHGHTLGCLSGPFLFVGSPGSGGWWKSSERTYIYPCEKLAICPPRDKAWLYKILTFFVSFPAITCWPEEGKTRKQKTLAYQKVYEHIPSS